MATPLDRHAHQRTGLVRAARLFSNIVSPPVIFAILGLALALKDLPPQQALPWAAFYGLFVSLLPILVVLYLLHTGRIAELHMSNSRERHLPYLAAVICAAIALVTISRLGGPELLGCLSTFNVIELAALGVINAFWLISIHATAISAAWLIVALVFGLGASLLVVPFVGAVLGVRLYLKRHTAAQLVGGVALGLATVLLVAQTGCFG